MESAPVATREPDSQEEFVKLLLANQRRITTYIATLLCSPNDVDDVFQDVGITLWQKFGQFKPGTSFSAWAYRIAYLKVLEFRRSQKHLPIFLSEKTLHAIAQVCSDQAEDNERLHQELIKCIAELDNSDRRLLQVRFAEKASLKSTAETLGHATNTVRKQLSDVYTFLLTCITKRLKQD